MKNKKLLNRQEYQQSSLLVKSILLCGGSQVPPSLFSTFQVLPEDPLDLLGEGGI